MTKEKPPTKEKPRKVLYTSLRPEDFKRVRAFGVREEARSGLNPKNSTLLAMLVRKGLDAVEAEASP